jgi:hypothetical protein
MEATQEARVSQEAKEMGREYKNLYYSFCEKEQEGWDK